MNNCFILLAAGQSKRFKSLKPKQYSIYRGKPLYEHSIDKANKSGLFKHIILVVNNRKNLKKNLSKNIKIIKGGKERSDSSYLALKYIKRFNVKNVLIHDAARPNFSINLMKKIIRGLKRHQAVVPFINSVDSAKYKLKNNTYNLIKKNTLLTQTPQGFRYKDLYKIAQNKDKVQDESSLFINQDSKVNFILGEKNNYKITFQKDLSNNNIFFGIGFDVHKLVPKRKLYLGGLKIKSEFGTLGHSDGDPVLHAITDSILGACKMGDIGQKFSDKNKNFKGIRSTIFLKKVINEIKQKNYFINNIDINIITQKPKISKYRNKMIKLIAGICEIEKDMINIKGKTTEKLGLIGKDKAIACEVITSVIKYD